MATGTKPCCRRSWLRLKDDGVDLELLGFGEDELDRLLADLNASPTQGEEEAIPEPPADAITRTGDLWILGSHRLLCGNSTVATDVERVLGGERPHLMVTDPPYGVEYDPQLAQSRLACRRQSEPAL